ncbi:MAG: DNA-binding transcriptional regulator, LysR family [Verrucomicrobia bacterium]|jgi:DNA-binding transcriptional LysR family regulator|nr:MAG: DNA-binding transcriptional regulator, LysR family [Verrucomicrobiota bacterium]
MELYQLEYFLEAARQRSFTRAAQSLHLAQAALSEQMRKLEAEFGTPFFNRGRRETTLTAAGEVMRRHAEILLTQAGTARREIHDLVELRAGRLLIGAIPSVSACVLPPAIALMRRDHPRIELSLLEGTSEQVAQWVESGRTELGIVQLPAPIGGFEETPLFTETFTLLVPGTHALANRKTARLGELAGEGFIFYKGRARDAALAACREAGFEPRIVCESGELDTIRSLVGAALGIALLPELATRAASPNCTRLRLAGSPVTRSVALLQRRGQSLSPSAQAFRQLLSASSPPRNGADAIL